jgi:hypothetical protein
VTLSWEYNGVLFSSILCRMRHAIGLLANWRIVGRFQVSCHP